MLGHLQDLPFAEPKSITATGRLDQTGVDLQSDAHLVFSDQIEAKISCAIDEQLLNRLVISSGDISMTVSDPWHCGQFQEGKSSIAINHASGLVEEISYVDQIGLFTREIEHASNCILNQKIESDVISHADTQSNMFWLDQWRQQMQIVCPKNLIKNSPVLESKAFLNQTTKLENVIYQG